ncbi:MAG TPA: hypothetical protein VGR07_13065, partial [Thermoanaerobaculia bacterium]|nr:hypothetical protein [Thermoanaerobaculia bacterium]
LRVKVRMYRQGLGDCFLLTFPSTGGKPFHLMIDCGVLVGTSDGSGQMQKVVQDVIQTTGGHLDLVVSTHQHWDHLSGFLQARDLFAPPEAPGPGASDDTDGKLHVQALWLAWTEDPTNRLANNLRAQRRHNEQALRATVQGLRLAGAAAADQVEDLLGFFGAAGAGSTEDALAALRSYARTAPRFCHPKDAPIALPEVPGIRFYVLGPPEDEKLIKRSNPSQSHPEVYGDPRMALNLDNAFFAAALGDDPVLADRSFPFDRRHQIPPQEAEQIRFFQRHYYAEDADSDFPDQAWRRIDGDWMGVASQLALQLDSNTNNTSLALAIELVDSGRVLLFPADAQVGNWLSWGDLAWQVPARNGQEQTVTAADLLRRTVLYKVGHHGSHNATLREQGLEEMVSGDLVALIPVDRKMAEKKHWKMPFPPLFDRLHEKASGRILRIDDTEKVMDRKVPDGVPAPLWSAFQASVVETPLFFEIAIDG